MKTHTINPLEWKYKRYYGAQEYKARVHPYGFYYILRECISYHPKEWGSWRWGFCYGHDFYNRSRDCMSVKDGKQKAWRSWRAKIRPLFKEERR